MNPGLRRKEESTVAFAKRVAMLVALAVLVGSSVAVAAVIPFDGSGSSGTIPPGSLQWTMTDGGDNIFRGVSIWGIPGLGNGNQTWPLGVGNLISFTITFNGLPAGVAIDQTPDPSPTGVDDFTRFHRGDDGVIWIPSFSGTNTVTFDPPTGYSMPPGTEFFLNIAFTDGMTAASAASVQFTNIDFTGSWTTDAVEAVPEPASISLVALAALGAALIGRRQLRAERS